MKKKEEILEFKSNKKKEIHEVEILYTAEI